ncbi:MAG: hypothetical protein GY853_01350 [PVC group bacterium]|nr:hypothetical protein [PVC group bacterium]
MIQKYKEKLSESKGRKNYIDEQMSLKLKEYDRLIGFQEDLQQAQMFLQAVAQKTQEQLKYHIRDIVQLAIDTVFPGECEFDIVFEIKRGKTEARLIFLEEGEEVDPLRDNAGGFVDMASLGLRIASWSLGETRPVIILDEPMKNLDKNKRLFGAQVIKDLSTELGLQFIIVTHDSEITNVADKVFEIQRERKGGYLISIGG